jgi:hypothetical protein
MIYSLLSSAGAERSHIMLKRTHKFELSNVEASIKKHPKLWIAASFISTFIVVSDVINILKGDNK